ncbi:MAG: BrnA antitoxin family protein [Nitrospinae bacterium]|nr:BrnA antitoxin family protein [Nitrospinota bacterium]
MNGNRKGTGSDLAKVDAHAITGVEYEEIPELDEDFFAEANEYVGGKLVKRGRPSGSGSKVSTTIRFDADVLSAFRTTGRGWQTRMNDALRDWLKTHPPMERH